jgi:hypothetical protein
MLRRPMFHGAAKESSQRSEERFTGTPRTVSPIYPRDPARNWDVLAGATSRKSVKDRFLILMRDRRFHTAIEMEHALPHGEWARVMRELLALNYAFDRIGDNFRLRLRFPAENRQAVGELLDGIDLTRVEIEEASTVNGDRENPRGVLEDRYVDDFDPATDVEGEGGSEDVRNGLVLSDPPGDLTLPVEDSATMTAAILAKKTSGKTYLAMVMAEEFMSSTKTQVPLVVLDPMGVWYGLRATADGMPSAFEFVIVGGSHGDIPITSKDGAVVADIANAVRPVSVVVDMLDLAPFEQHEFVADFGERFFATSPRSPLHMIVDEADEFAPQRLNKGSRHHKRCLDAMDRLVRRGRNKGIGMTMITQRSAVISKNLLSQVDCLWLLSMVAPNDLRAVDDWLSHRVTSSQRSECMSQISRLPPGIAYFTQSGLHPKFRRFRVRRKKTFDSSRTPGGLGRLTPVFARPPARALEVARSIMEHYLSERVEVSIDLFSE